MTFQADGKTCKGVHNTREQPTTVSTTTSGLSTMTTTTTTKRPTTVTRTSKMQSTKLIVKTTQTTTTRTKTTARATTTATGKGSITATAPKRVSTDQFLSYFSLRIYVAVLTKKYSLQICYFCRKIIYLFINSFIQTILFVPNVYKT